MAFEEERLIGPSGAIVRPVNAIVPDGGDWRDFGGEAPSRRVTALEDG